MASDPKWVESGKLSWQRMEDIRAAAKKPPYAPWATVSGCATAWDTQFSGEGLSGARTFYFLHTLLEQTFQELSLFFASIPEVLIRFHDFQVRPDPGVMTHRKCKTSLLLFSTGNVLHVEENFTTFLPKSFNFCTKKCLTIKFCASLGRKPRPDVECGPEEECDEEENTEGEASGSTEVQIVSIQI